MTAHVASALERWKPVAKLKGGASTSGGLRATGTLEKNSSGPCDSQTWSRDVFAARDGRPCIAEHDGGVTRSSSSSDSERWVGVSAGTREMLIRVLFCFVRPCQLSLTGTSLACT